MFAPKKIETPLGQIGEFLRIFETPPTQIGPWAKIFETPPDELVAGGDLKDLPPGSNGRVNRNVQTRKSQISNWLSWSLIFFKIYDNSREAHSACFYWSESYFDPPNGYPKVEISSVFLKIHVFGSKIRMSPKVDRVWGDPKSKFCPKTPFLKRKYLDQIFTKNLKTFQKKTREVLAREKKHSFFSPTVNSGQEIFNEALKWSFLREFWIEKPSHGDF